MKRNWLTLVSLCGPTAVFFKAEMFMFVINAQAEIKLKENYSRTNVHFRLITDV